MLCDSDDPEVQQQVGVCEELLLSTRPSLMTPAKDKPCQCYNLVTDGPCIPA